MLTSVALIASSPLGSSVRTQDGRTQDGRGAAWGLHELLAPEGSSGSPLTAAAVGLPRLARSAGAPGAAVGAPVGASRRLSGAVSLCSGCAASTHVNGARAPVDRWRDL